MRIEIFFIILVSIFCLESLTAQKNNKKITISGTVLDVSKIPIEDAIIMVDGQNTSSVTNSEGKYKVRVKPNATEIGVFTFGNGIIEDSINGRNLINFNFSTNSVQVQDFEIAPGEEGVNVGYSYVKKKNLTGNMAVIDFKNSKKTYSNIHEMIQEIPGIRTKVFNLFGPVGPSYVVNGIMVSSIDYIQPSEVESIVFLKDSSAAIYGSRAFGGVILIKTKVNDL